MDLSEITESTKKYWPFALGALALLIFWPKLRGEDSASTPAVDYGGISAANTATILANAEASARLQEANTAAKIADYNYDISQKTLAANEAVNILEANSRELNITYGGQVDLIGAESELIRTIAESQAIVINANNAIPLATISALQSGGDSAIDTARQIVTSAIASGNTQASNALNSATASIRANTDALVASMSKAVANGGGTEESSSSLFGRIVGALIF